VSTSNSTTHWIRELQAGEPAPAQKLWENYFQRLVGLARQKLRTLPRRAADEEDVALSAFDSLCRRAEAGRFPRLEDCDDRWQRRLLRAPHGWVSHDAIIGSLRARSASE
jgi:ECF sigma factor